MRTYDEVRGNIHYLRGKLRSGVGRRFRPNADAHGGRTRRHRRLCRCVRTHIEEVSEVSGTLSGAYTGTIGSGWDWTARLGVRHQGPQFRDIANLMELAPQTLVNGQLSFANDNWDVILYGANLTDDDSVLDVQCGWRDRSLPGRGAAQANCRYRPRLPRELGLRLNYSF